MYSFLLTIDIIPISQEITRNKNPHEGDLRLSIQ